MYITMTPAGLFFYLTCVVLGKTAQDGDNEVSSFVHQQERFVSVKAGGSVTLRCFYKRDVGIQFYWYKKTPGQKPRLISSFNKYSPNIRFFSEFQNNPRFTVDTENPKNHLSISDVHISDSGTYYCASSSLYRLDFGEGTTVSVEGSDVNVQTLVHQSSSESVHPGDSVTLNCMVHTETCDGEHNIYWFKKSEDPQPGIIYTHRGTNDQCERKPDTQTHTCVYNLPILKVDNPHDGTYYCAVASCGRVLLGNETKLEFNDVDTLAMVYLFCGALAFTTMLIGFLTFSIYKLNMRNNCKCTESPARYPAPSTANKKGYQDARNVYCAASSVNLVNRSRNRSDNTWTECVYFNVQM
ncbi:immunoglobulin kappa light chain-like [Sphaeramia orbicularis]|uniref:Immunoglobulin kappa light chain-like n=1 Tax=Sphaeramia orbicularis TaxID=375764 RepID=A0A673CKB6_9TELE|nr:immunoglobulin kappa light chain-like [Sphaeramia orbicularis]